MSPSDSSGAESALSLLFILKVIDYNRPAKLVK